MWISKGEYKRLLRALARSEQRADNLFAALAEERTANREAERHWANMLLRAKQTYPLPPKAVPIPSSDEPELQPAGEVPGMDEGELEALIAAGAQYGVDRASVIRTLREERGL